MPTNSKIIQAFRKLPANRLAAYVSAMNEAQAEVFRYALLAYTQTEIATLTGRKQSSINRSLKTIVASIIEAERKFENEFEK